MDLGTGDGRAAAAIAEAEPGTLVVGVDADAASMADTSRRAARPAGRGGLPNLLFVAAAAESPPSELIGLADEVRVHFPWASLLRGLLGRDPRVAAGIAALAAPGGRVTALVSVAPRDGVDGLVRLDASAFDDVAERLEPSGLVLVDARPASTEEVRGTRSTWGRRLSAGTPDRPVWHVELVRATPVEAAPDRGPGRRRRWAAV